LDFDSLDTPLPGTHYRPLTSDDLRFNQRCVPALIVPGLCYAVLGAFTPFDIGVNLWALVSLIVLPGVCGLIVHSIGDAVSIHKRAKRAFMIEFIVFVVYAIVNMAMIHDRIQSSSSGPGSFIAMAMSAVGYGIVAAAVAGFMASLPVHHHTEAGY
jgi:hypothetical protein